MDDLEKRFAAVWEEVRQESAAREAEERAAGSGEKIQGEQIRRGSRKKSTKQNATRAAEKPKHTAIAEPVNSSPCLPSVADVETVERVQGEVLEPSPDDVITPEEFAGMIQTIRCFVHAHIYNDIPENEPEERILKKEVKTNPQIWRSLCAYVGKEYFKKYGILRDTESTGLGSAKKLNPYKVLALSDIFLSLCADYGAMPFQKDFACFAGVSNNYMIGKNSEGRALTSTLVNLSQKFKENQEIDLSRRLGHGVQNPTGAIFVLKNLHGWKDERTVEHVDGTQTALKAAELPRLDGLVVSDQ